MKTDSPFSLRNGVSRSIDLRFSLSGTATVVSILQRKNVPALVAVAGGRAGANALSVAIPRRVRAGRYTIKLVFGAGTEQQTLTRSITVPR